jgi:hypothetical protein
MNREQTIEAIRIMQSFVDGKEVISQFVTSPQATDNPSWNWVNDISAYRIKPTATPRPWTVDEVPLGAWMRKKQDVTHRWVVIDTGNELWRQAWFEDSEHSTDNGKTWLHCGVVEEAK